MKPKKDKRYKYQLTPHLTLVAHGIPRMSPPQRKNLKKWLIQLADSLEKQAEIVSEIFTGSYP